MTTPDEHDRPVDPTDALLRAVLADNTRRLHIAVEALREIAMTWTSPSVNRIATDALRDLGADEWND